VIKTITFGTVNPYQKELDGYNKELRKYSEELYGNDPKKPENIANNLPNGKQCKKQAKLGRLKPSAHPPVEAKQQQPVRTRQ